ncbi:hypothetical protein LMG22037_05621 [Paraburkholderia phenoliruptrix]|uniref:Uncharacterized protein n=1 Tax=Paraburkholderia phenoliruptrix TaxID=252970 RepID=A0A6J5CCW3_9BURK|nr:hypothetical protein [Paraburkholderia phenoliruptrix]CAB3731527.1 hypothetical protein LMG22037_05621 [Paraburkholderia phenoliruptrix]
MSSLSISVNGGTIQVVQLGTLSAAVNQQITQAVSASAASASAAAASASSASSTVGTALAALLPQNLLEWAYSSAFRLVSATRDANEAIVTASIVWPDGGTGTFTTDTASTAFPGAIDAWHATYVNGNVTHTVTQPAVTRDSNGAVTAQPAITIT